MAGTNQVTWTDKVNTRTLPIPIINKIDDATVNELKNKHNALDTEMTDPTTGLKKVVEDLGTGKQDDLGITDETAYLLTPKPIQEGSTVETKYQTETDVEEKIAEEVPEPDEDNFETPLETNITYIKSLFAVKENFTVNFLRSAIHGSPLEPIYWKLTIDLLGAIAYNKVIINHSSLNVPEAFEKVWEEPTDSYVDETAMFAAQGAQLSGLVYNIGVVYWRYLGTTNGNITDYELVLHVVLKGDTYLSGVANLNVLSMEFLPIHQESTFLIPNCLVVTNTAYTNGNFDIAKPDLRMVVDAKFNENKVLTSDPTLVNSASLYAEDTNIYVTNPAEFQYNSLGGGDFSLQNSNISSSSLRGAVFITLSASLKKLMESQNKITVIAKLRRRSTSSDTGNLTIAGNFDSVNQLGWQFVITNVSTTPRYTFRAQNGSRNAGSTPATFAVNGNDNPFWCACVFDGNDVKFYQRSTERSQAFQEMTYLTNGLTSKNITGGFNDIRLQGENNTSTIDRQRDNYQMFIFFDTLTAAQVEALMID
jgi:hypothetical protein